MQLATLFVSQRRLRNPGQIHALVEAIQNGYPLPPVRLSEDDDGSIQVEDGHHRTTAYWIAGTHQLSSHQYLLLPVSERPRHRFGTLRDFVSRNAPAGI
ncbi:MAG TPA: DUF262 domain-containing protein [Verrucomicrobiales bacterium]|jgi:hypothetical protein|nr:DUF262 domain-containing protein [Verrucomicrobiales bacterium]